jgi:hypothetical protein
MGNRHRYALGIVGVVAVAVCIDKQFRCWQAVACHDVQFGESLLNAAAQALSKGRVATDDVIAEGRGLGSMDGACRHTEQDNGPKPLEEGRHVVLLEAMVEEVSMGAPVNVRTLFLQAFIPDGSVEMCSDRRTLQASYLAPRWVAGRSIVEERNAGKSLTGAGEGNRTLVVSLGI